MYNFKQTSQQKAKAMNILFQILLINIFTIQSQCNNFLWSYPIYVFSPFSSPSTSSSRACSRKIYKILSQGSFVICFMSFMSYFVSNHQSFLFRWCFKIFLNQTFDLHSMLVWKFNKIIWFNSKFFNHPSLSGLSDLTHKRPLKPKHSFFSNEIKFLKLNRALSSVKLKNLWSSRS